MNPVSIFWNRLVGPSLARYGRYLVLFTVALSVLAGYRAATEPRKYRSKASVTVGNTISDTLIGVGNPAMNFLLQREQAIANSRETYARLRLPAGTSDLATTAAYGSFELNFFASAPTPELAQTAAAAYATAYIEESSVRRKESYLRSAGFLRESLATAEKQLAEARTPADKSFFRVRATQLRAKLLDTGDLASRPEETSVERTDEATLPTHPINRPPALAAAIGLVFGVNISAALVLLLDFGHRQRLSLDQLRKIRSQTRTIGITPLRRLGQSAAIGGGLRAALSELALPEGPAIVGVAVLGSRGTPHSVSAAVASAAQTAGVSSVHVRLRRRGAASAISQRQNEWDMTVPADLPIAECEERLHVEMQQGRHEIAVTEGVRIDSSEASTLPLDLSDAVVLVIDTLTSTEPEVSGAIETLRGIGKPPVGIVLIDR